MEVFQFGRASIRPSTRDLRVDGRAAPLSSRAFDLLQALIERRHRVVGVDELLTLVWPGRVVEDSNLRVHVVTLRKLLGSQTITTVPGQGYRFTAELHPGASTLAGPAQLYGRAADLEKLRILLAAHALVSVVGAGGVGKTSLVRALVRGLGVAEVGAEVGAEIVVLDLSPLGDATQLVPAVASACQVLLGAGPALQALAGQLRRRHLLLVLDNAEHMLAEVAAMVAALLADGNPLRVLVTSQAPLRLHAEQV